MKWGQLAFVSLSAIMAGWLMGPDVWGGVRADLLVFMGIYAAALIQVAVTTANLNLPDYLTVDEARRLSRQLIRQQRYWVGLFIAIILFVLSLVVASMLSGVNLSIDVSGIGVIDFGKFISGFLGGLFSFILFHTVIFLNGLLSVQRLRAHLLELGALRRAKADADKIIEPASSNPLRMPEGYGSVHKPH